MNREQLARIAMRYDTALSRAMLKALGIEARMHTRRGAVVTDRYNGMHECMRQRYGVRM